MTDLPSEPKATRKKRHGNHFSGGKNEERRHAQVVGHGDKFQAALFALGTSSLHCASSCPAPAEGPGAGAYCWGGTQPKYIKSFKMSLFPGSPGANQRRI